MLGFLAREIKLYFDEFFNSNFPELTIIRNQDSRPNFSIAYTASGLQ